MSRWRIFKAYYEWHVYEYGRERYESFPTWREAMDYADAMARTVEVTLPPVVDHPSDDVPAPAWHMPGEFIRHWISTAHGKVWMTDHRGLGDLMDADVAERRGLALIAAAKHAKGELS
ncbi:hypothetical protein HMPREF2978_00665 [Corynebacterium sp. HMSC074C01]|uniref:hypothetical protein n=1 Tax=Corynebacterium sp. HMSC074C01 TaxID=1739482 RepID=UPI0008A2FFD4|nr:hypothetical protein [Corynebacterium sp. HMSC074C01]OFP63527.1 hypothetical protein HMPREF2978_00665 [Corynebacterium sp. HMSC074C01]